MKILSRSQLKKNSENFIVSTVETRICDSLQYIIMYFSIILLSANELYIDHFDLHIYIHKSRVRSHDHSRDYENFIFNIRLK